MAGAVPHTIRRMMMPLPAVRAVLLARAAAAHLLLAATAFWPTNWSGATAVLLGALARNLAYAMSTI